MVALSVLEEWIGKYYIYVPNQSLHSPVEHHGGRQRNDWPGRDDNVGARSDGEVGRHGGGKDGKKSGTTAETLPGPESNREGSQKGMKIQV